MKKFGISLDRSSKIILTLAIVGIVASFFLLKHFSNFSLSDSDEAKIASITFYTNDVRLKRSTTLNWSKIEEQANCFIDDRIFTGPASTATIEFLNGSKVTLQPNSLVSLSAGFISLNSGSIDVDLSRGQLEVESFGEKFKPTPKSKFRVENLETSKRILPIGETKIEKWEKTKTLEKFVKVEKLNLLSPVKGEKIPKFSDQEIDFTWDDSDQDLDEAVIQFSQDSSFSTIVHQDSAPSTPTQIQVSSLPTGPLYWRLMNKDKEISNRESFSLFEVPPIALQSPPAEKVISLITAKEGVEFTWTNESEIPKVLQVSSSEDFSESVQSVKVEDNKAVVALESSGKFFWRVGHQYATNRREWSQASSFSVAPSLQITQLDKKLDFNSIDDVEVKVKSEVPCEEFEFIISQGEKIITSLKSKTANVALPKLTDGKYELRVTGFSKGEVVSESEPKPFKVKNSPPLQKPTIKNKKKVNLFVRAVSTLFDLIFPSAEAAPQAFYRLQWDGDEESEYEVEISKPDGEIVLKKKVKGLSYKFLVSGPEKYRWRVRLVRGKKASEFSDYAEILIHDKITSFKKPRMISPKNGAKLPDHGDKVRVEFRWEELPAQYDTFLEIYDGPKSKKPFIKEAVSGDSHELVLTDPPKVIYWRVYAQSIYKNKTTSEHRFAIKTSRVDVRPGYYTLSPQVAFFKSKLSVSYDRESAEAIPDYDSLSGPAAGLAGEYFLGRADHKRSIAATVMGYALADGKDKLTEVRTLLEYGILKNEHRFYVGTFLTLGELNLPSQLEASFLNLYVSGRYVFARNLSENWQSLSSILLLVTHNTTPSFYLRQTFSRRLNKRLALDLFGQIEQLSAKSEVDGTEATTKLTSFGAGLGLTWVLGRVE